MSRDINDVLFFRDDISPFLVHLTKKDEDFLTGECTSAKKRLKSILTKKMLMAGEKAVSSAQYGRTSPDGNQSEYFAAVCFTETPLSQVHCLLDIANRTVNLEPYGLVFFKESLRKVGVSPVLYLNNTRGDQDDVNRALCTLISSAPTAARKLLPLFSFFGKKLQPQWEGAPQASDGDIDFLWEREWRYPVAGGHFKFTYEDIFVGLCPDGDIADLESSFPGLPFVDPTRPMAWDATKLVARRRAFGLQYSVV
jgi:hypothetical protein